MNARDSKSSKARKAHALFRVRAAPQQRARVRKLAREGQLVQMGRGIYRVADAPLESHEDLALVALRKPEAVVCLLSALRFHELTIESPGSVWIAVENHSRPPRIDTLQLRVHLDQLPFPDQFPNARALLRRGTHPEECVRLPCFRTF